MRDAVRARLVSGPRVDLLVNNAGIGHERPFLTNGTASEERLLDLNVRAVLRLTDAALTAMTDRRGGAILGCNRGRSRGQPYRLPSYYNTVLLPHPPSPARSGRRPVELSRLR